MYFDRFDIVLAHYVYCTHFHGGQSCPLYARLCRIGAYFSPTDGALAMDGDEYDNAREIYHNLIEGNSNV